MDTNHPPRRPDGASPEAASDDAAAFPATPPPGDPGAPPVEAESAPPPASADEDAPPHLACIEFGGHMPAIVDPLVPPHPDTAFTETRHYRRDGWTPERKRLFLERLAECGVIVEACEAAGMSARSAYNLRDRDSLFAAGMEAASVMARPRLADEAWSRALNGVMERIYRDGVVVAERHHYDNRLTMSVLGRLDARIDRAEEKGAPHLQLIPRWDDYLDALAEDRREDGLALLAPPVPGEVEGPDAAPCLGGEVQGDAEDRELRELYEQEEAEMAALEDEEEDPHEVWEDDDGTWLTDYPPPAGFDGEEYGEYGDYDYNRTLSPEEQAVIDADQAEEKAASLARGEALRAAWFAVDPPAADPPAGDPPAADPPLDAAQRSHGCHEKPPLSHR